jgi:lysophospholipase L1-like esterase
VHRIGLQITGIFLAIVIAYVLAVILRMAMLLQQSKQLVAVSEAFEQSTPTAYPRILVLGDSTAVGTGVNDSRDSIAGKFGKDFPDALIVNRAINGLKAGELDKNFPTFPEHSFDLVLLHIGANDILRHTPPDAFTASLSSVFQKARKTGTHVVALHSGNIGLAPIFGYWPFNTYFRRKTLQYRSRYRDIAATEGVTYVDLFKEAKEDPFRSDEARFYAADGLHLAEAGYEVWYRSILEAMKKDGISF